MVKGVAIEIAIKRVLELLMDLLTKLLQEIVVGRRQSIRRKIYLRAVAGREKDK